MLISGLSRRRSGLRGLPGTRVLMHAATFIVGLLCATAATAEILFVHNDHRGAPIAMTDANKNVVWRADYDPFGKATVTVQTRPLNLRLPGQYFDAETGLHYNYYRDYDPTTGRYLQPDPIGLAGGLNPYAYVGNNPLRYIDPLGLEPLLFARPPLIPRALELIRGESAAKYADRVQEWSSKEQAKWKNESPVEPSKGSVGNEKNDTIFKLIKQAIHPSGDIGSGLLPTKGSGRSNGSECPLNDPPDPLEECYKSGYCT